MKKLSLIGFLLLAGIFFSKAQVVPTCSPDVPYYNVDLTGHPDGVWESPGHSRQGNCCGTVSPDRCTSFDVTLDPQAAMVSFNIASGAVPPGALFYQINCGPQIPVGQPICIVGLGTFHITFCKPGNNQNTYILTSIPKPIFPSDATVRFGCSKLLTSMGMVPSSITWNSIYPGTSGQYNSYLSCTSGCAVPLYTPTISAPAYIDYRICGSPIAAECGFVATCDTVRIYNVGALTSDVTPHNAMFCAGGGGVLLTATSAGGDGNYSYIWRNQNGTIVGNGSTYLATAAGNYTMEARDGLYDASLCPAVLLNVPVIVGQPPVVNAGPDQIACTSAPIAYLSATKTNATGVVWTGGNGTYNPNNTSLNTAYTPTPAEIAAGSVTLTATSVGAGGGCTNSSDAVTIFYPPLLTASLASQALSCFGTTAILSPVVSGGIPPYSYSWNNGTWASSAIVGAGNYCVSVTDSIGCHITVCANVTVPNELLISTNGIDATTVGGNDGTATATVTGGTPPYTYLWSPGGQTTSTATGLTYGIYIVTVTDANGCSKTSSTVVNDPHCLGLEAFNSGTNVLCFGELTGTLSTTVTGGTAPYSYSWNTSPVSTTDNVSAVGAGAYDLTVTDFNNCIDIESYVIHQPSKLTNTMNHTNNTTVGGTNATASANPAGGTSPYSYAWSNGAATQAISGLVAGTYNVTVTDFNGCSLVDSVHVYDPNCSNIIMNIYATNVSCPGGSDAGISAQILFDTPPYTYHWSTGATTPSISGLPAGVYSVIGYGSGLCPNFATIIITEPAPLSLGMAVTNISCAPVNDGTIDLTVSGGTFPYSFNWSTGINVEDQYLLTNGTYSVTVTDAHGCTATGSTSVTRPIQLSVTGTPTNVTCNGGNDGLVNVTVTGGVAPYTYSWSNGATTEDISGLTTGQYILIAKDANHCTTSAALSMLIDEPEKVRIDTIIVSCPIPNSGVAEVTAAISGGNNGPYQISFDNGSTYLASGVYSKFLAVGANYNVIAKDGNGCLSIVKVLHINPAVTISSVSFAKCFASGSSTTPVTVFPVGGAATVYQVSFNNGSSFGTAGNYTSSQAFANAYDIVIKDALGCVSPATHIVIPDTLYLGAVTSSYSGGYNISCNGLTNGSITLSVSGGTRSYSFAWTGPNGFTSTSQNISGLAAGTYTVTLTDAFLCTKTKTITLTQPTVLGETVISPTVIGGYNITCNGVSDGSINLTVSGGTSPYTFAWTGPNSYSATIQNLTGLAAGIYYVTVTDANACIANTNITLTQPPPLNNTLTGSTVAGGYNITCHGAATGSIINTVSGGVQPYSYLWSGPNSFIATTQNLSGLGVGTYTVIITDANGCSTIVNSADITLTEPPVLTSTISSPTVAGGYNITCHGTATGSVLFNPSGGTAPYIFSWTGPGTYTSSIQSPIGLIVGAYNVHVIDANGCTTDNSIELTEPALLTANATSPTVAGGYNITCNGSSTGSITLVINGGTANYSFAWTGPSSYVSVVQNPSGLFVGNYNVVVTDANGCIANTGITLIQPPPLSNLLSSLTVAGGYNITCNGETNGSINNNVSGGVAPYTYLWSGPNSFAASTQNISGLGMGTYTVLITDANGCSTIANSADITLTEPPVLTSAISSPIVAGGYNITCNGAATGSIVFNASGGTGPYTYSWTGAGSYISTTQNQTGLVVGTYNVTVTDANGCTATNMITLTEPEVLSSNISSPTVEGAYNITCSGALTGGINLNVTGGTSTYLFNWSGPGEFDISAQNPTGLIAGTFSVLITDANGCTANNTITLTQPEELTSSVSSPTVAGGYNITCNGTLTGDINLAVNGGTANYNYSWIGPASFTSTLQNPIGLVAGTYNVIISDANGCTATNTITLTEPAVLESTISSPAVAGGYNITCNGDSNGAIIYNVTGGTASYSYNWTGPAPFVSTVQNPVGLIAGTYNVTVTDANSCVTTNTITLTEPAVLTSSLTSPTVIGGYNITCNGLSNGSVNTNVSGGTNTYNYVWTGPNSYSSTLQNPIGLSVGTYNVSITDANGCNAANTITLTEPTLLGSTLVSPINPGGYNIRCKGDLNGSINLTANGGTPGYAYSWTGPAGFTSTIEDIGSLSAGTYTVIVTDSNSCSVTNSITLTEPNALTLLSIVSTYTETNISCFGNNDGNINITVNGGSPAYTYSWAGPSGYSSTLEDAALLIAGAYNVTVTDVNGCTIGSTYNLSQPTLLTSYVTTTPATCSAATGAADLSISGGTVPYSTVWSNAAVTEDITNVVGGTYTVTILDANGCRLYDTASVGEISIMALNSVVSGMLCNGSNEGYINIEVINGTMPFAYTWSTGATSSGIANLGAGIYSVTVTDGSGCIVRDSFNVQQSTPIELVITSAEYTGGHNISSYHGNDGAIQLDVTGGQVPYIYSWSNNVTSQNQTNLSDGVYSVVVTDGLGCTAFGSVKLDEPMPLAMPNGFSPNGDGRNDLFEIHGIEVFPNNELTIFNRWGNIVNQFTGYDNKWDGSSANGEILPNGTYFVILVIQGEDIVLKGYVDLRK